MIVWSGRGFTALLVLLLAFAVFVKIIPAEQKDYVFVLSLFIAGAFSWVMGKKWNEKETKTYIDKESGQEVTMQANHSLFWIKLQYWGIIFAGIGLIILVQQLLK